MPYAPRATFDNPYGPQITFRTEDVLPPTAYYISPEDRVTVWVITDVSMQTIYLQLRMLMPTGEIKLIPYQAATSATLVWYVALEVPPWEGYLLGAMCWSTNAQRGQCFVSVQVMRSAPPNLQVGGIVLLQGYISALNVLSYPTSQLEGTFSGRGAFLTITQPNQTGTNLLIGPPSNTLWRLCSLTFALTTSTVAGNRYVSVTVVDMNNVTVGVWSSNAVQAPNSILIYSFAPGCQSTEVGPFVTIAAPGEIFVPAQSSLRTNVEGFDPGDMFSQIAGRFEEWVGA